MTFRKLIPILVASLVYAGYAMADSPQPDSGHMAKDDNYEDILSKLARSKIVRGSDVCYFEKGSPSEIRRYCAGKSVIHFKGINIGELSFLMANVCDPSKPTTTMVNGITGFGFCSLRN